MVPLVPFQLIALAAGLLYGLLALAVWTILRQRHHRLPVALWTGGALLVGLGLALLGAHGWVPGAFSMGVSGHLFMASILLRIMALRHEMGLPLRAGRSVLAWTTGVAVFWLCGTLPWDQAQLYCGSAMLVAGTGLFARQAAVAGRQLGSRTGRWLSGMEGLLCVVIGLRTLAMALGWVPARGVNNTWDFAVVISVAVVAGLFVNLGYLGMVVDRSRAARQAASDAQWVERLRREAAEDRAAALRDLLTQRDQLAAERDQLLALLAHEIRQPLHNANGALLAARAVLAEPRPDVDQRAFERLLRAQDVLADVRSVLDNTLAASSLLGSGGALYVPETALEPLVTLALGDLPEAQRRQVSVQWQDSGRSAELEAGLVRLALRNLLRNAFSHGGPAVSVVLRIERSSTPEALVISVIDDGVGPPPGWRPAPLEVPASADGHRPRPRGLGLTIVREVMARHGGSMDLSARQPHGLTARLVFPQGQGATHPTAGIASRTTTAAAASAAAASPAVPAARQAGWVIS